MELRHLRYFVTAAEEGSISRAAARLSISQPAISRQIHDLEEELTVQLFRRQPQGLTLTEDGETALIHAKDLLRRAKSLTSTFKSRQSKPSSTIQVGYIPTALPGFLAEGLRRFNAEHSDTCVQIREMSPREQENALEKGEIDLALLGTACPNIVKRYATRTILKTPMSIVLPNNHLLALRKSIDLNELEGEPFISLHERHFPGRGALISYLSEKAGFAIKVAMKVDGLSEALGMVASGAGVAVLPADTNQLPHPGVVFVKMKRPRLYLTSSAAWSNEAPNDQVSLLVKHLEEAGANKTPNRKP